MINSILKEVSRVRWCTLPDLVKKTLLSIVIIAFVAIVFVGYDVIISSFIKLFL